MANVKNVILKEKIEGVIYDLLVKTNANLVEVEEGKTLATALTELTTAINGKVGTQEVENKIKRNRRYSTRSTRHIKRIS